LYSFQPVFIYQIDDCNLNADENGAICRILGWSSQPGAVSQNGGLCAI
jgi:hypothetical protein